MTKQQERKKNEKVEKELYKKYIDLIGFMEYTKLNVKVVINFLYINYERIAEYQETFEEVIGND